MDTLVKAARDTTRLEAVPVVELCSVLDDKLIQLGFPDIRIAALQLETADARALRLKHVSIKGRCVETGEVCFPIRECRTDDDGRPLCVILHNCEERCIRWEDDTWFVLPF